MQDRARAFGSRYMSTAGPAATIKIENGSAAFVHPARVGSSTQSSLERLELLQAGLRLVSGHVVLGVRDIFLGILDRLSDHICIEVSNRLSPLGEHGQPRRPHLGRAAVHDDALRLTVAINRENAGL